MLSRIKVLLIEYPIFRAVVPALLVGMSGVLTNLLAWQMTRQATPDYSVIVRSGYTYLFVLSASLLAYYEIRITSAFKKYTRASFAQEFHQVVGPQVIAQAKDLARKGEIQTAKENVEHFTKMMDDLSKREEKLLGSTLKTDVTLYNGKKKVCTLCAGVVVAFDESAGSYMLRFAMKETRQSRHGLMPTDYKDSR